MSGEHRVASDEGTRGGRDQAETLRIMVSSSRPGAPARSSASAPERPWVIPHRLIVVTGGRAGVGTTTIARNLAAGATHRGIRALYVGPDAGAAPSPGKADYYLMDAGASADLEGLADYLVLVTTPDAEAVKGVYLALKRFRESDPGLTAGIVVNRAGAPEEGVTLGERIASAARAFIRGSELDVLGWVLEDRHSAAAKGRPFVAASPRSAAAAGIRLCVRRLWSRWQPRGRVLAA